MDVEELPHKKPLTTRINIGPVVEPQKFLGQRSYTGKATFDEFSTPPKAIDRLINVLKMIWEKTDFMIWEPCCGRLNSITNRLIERGYTNVFASDIQGIIYFIIK